MNPAINGQYMTGANLIRGGGESAAGEPAGPYVCSATCSLAEGNAHATCIRRSWRNTKRI
jgi:hypothetical protein